MSGTANVRGDDVRVSTRVSVPSSAFSAHVAPPPAAMLVGVLPAG